MKKGWPWILWIVAVLFLIVSPPKALTRFDKQAYFAMWGQEHVADAIHEHASWILDTLRYGRCLCDTKNYHDDFHEEIAARKKAVRQWRHVFDNVGIADNERIRGAEIRTQMAFGGLERAYSYLSLAMSSGNCTQYMRYSQAAILCASYAVDVHWGEAVQNLRDVEEKYLPWGFLPWYDLSISQKEKK